MKLPIPIYLDTAFITEAYEKAKGTVPVRITRRSNVSGGLSVGILSAGATMVEEKEFPVSSWKMYDEVADHFRKYPTIELHEKKASDFPELFWAEGLLCGAQAGLMARTETTARADLFRLEASTDKIRRWIYLVTNDAYFVTGYDQLAKYGYAVTCRLNIRVRLLVRLICLDNNDAVGAPMVIIKTSNSPGTT